MENNDINIMRKRVFLIIFALTMFLVSCNHSGKTSQSTDTTREVVNAPKPAGALIEEAYKNGDWDKIISIGDTLIGDDDPKNISIVYAEALAAKGNIEKAIKVLDKKIIKNPDDYYLYNTKGNVFFVAEKYDSAIYYYDKTTEMRPTYARPYICKGEIYEAIGEKEKAIKNYMVATYLFARNNFETEAYEMERRILRLDPNYKEVKELMHDMGLE